MRFIAALVAVLFGVVGLVVFLSVSAPVAELPVHEVAEAGDPPAYLSGTTSRIVVSETTGRTYQISVTLPRTYDTSNETYPVLYAVDANIEFGTVVETARLMQLEGLIPELIVVGIGYPVGTFIEALAPRAVDLTPTEDRGFQERAAVAEANSDRPVHEGNGGAPGFLRFVREELIPSIEAEYRADPRGRALYGHSFGGLFAFYSLLEGEGTFHRFIVGSPSLWWDQGVSFELEDRFAETHSALPARAFFSVGMLEDEGPNDAVPWGQLMVSNLRTLLDVLDERNYEGFEFASHFFEDETHTSVVPATISRGLRYIYGEEQ